MDTDTGVDVIPIRFMGFPGGMDYTAEDCTLDFNTLRVIQNAVIDRRGALTHPGGVGPDVVTAGLPHDFTRFYKLPDANVSTIVDQWVHVSDSAGSTFFSMTDPNTSAIINLATLHSITPFDNCVIQVAGRVIATDRDHLPAVWYGLGTTALTLGYPDPNPDPVVALDFLPTVGPPYVGLDTTGLDPYLYTASFVDKWGNETNPIPVFSTGLPFINTAVGHWAEILVPRTALTGIMPEADLATINVWRIGGNNASLRLCLSFTPITSGGFFVSAVLPPSFNSNVDSTQDSALPDVFANYANIPPPRGLLVLILHIGRLFGFGESATQAVMDELGSPARLWFSRPFMYNSWGNTDDGIDDDGGFLDIDDNHYDKLLGATSTGSVLVLGRLSSVYTLFGNGFQTFRFDRRADHGIASRRAITRHVNVARYIASDFYPYELGNTDSVRIGRSVERYIDTLADASRTVCFSHNGRFFACIPQASIGQAKTFVLDDRTGAWTLVNEFEINAAHSLEQPTGGRPELMGADRRGFLRRFLNPAPVSPNSVTLELRTDRIRPSPLGDKCYFKAIRIDGEFTGGPLTVTLTCESTVKSYLVFAGGFRFLYIDSLPMSLTGEWIEVAITGQWTAGEIRRIELTAIPIRKTVLTP